MKKGREKTGIPTKTLFSLGVVLSFVFWFFALLTLINIHNSEKAEYEKQAGIVAMTRYKHDFFHTYSDKPEQTKFYGHAQKTTEEFKKITKDESTENKDESIANFGRALNALARLANDVSYYSYYQKYENSKEFLAGQLTWALVFAENGRRHPQQFQRDRLESEIGFLLFVDEIQGKSHLKRETVLEHLGVFFDSVSSWLSSAKRLKAAVQLMRSDWMFSTMALDKNFRFELPLMARGEYKIEPASLLMPVRPNFWPAGYKLVSLIAFFQAFVFLVSLTFYYKTSVWNDDINGYSGATEREMYGSFFTPNWWNPLAWLIILAAYAAPAIASLVIWASYRIGSWPFKVRAANAARFKRLKKSLDPDAILQQGNTQLTALEKLIR